MRIIESPSLGPLAVVVSRGDPGHALTLRGSDPRSFIRNYLNTISSWEPRGTRRQDLEELRRVWARRPDGADVVAECDRLLAQVYTIRY